MESRIPIENTTMSLHHFYIDDFPVVYNKLIPSNMWLIDKRNDERVDFYVESIHEIDVEEIKYYLPSKILWDKEMKGFQLIYYINDNFLPRPFLGEKKVYCFYIKQPPCCYSFNYDGRVQKFFLDQVINDGWIHYMFFVGESDFQYLFFDVVNVSSNEKWSGGLEESLQKIADLSKK